MVLLGQTGDKRVLVSDGGNTRGPGIVPGRNPIPACKQSPEEGSWQEVLGGGRDRGVLSLPAPSPIARWGCRDELPAPVAIS